MRIVPGTAARPHCRKYDSNDGNEIIRKENVGAMEKGMVCTDEEYLCEVEDNGEDKVSKCDDENTTEAAHN